MANLHDGAVAKNLGLRPLDPLLVNGLVLSTGDAVVKLGMTEITVRERLGMGGVMWRWMEVVVLPLFTVTVEDIGDKAHLYSLSIMSIGG